MINPMRRRQAARAFLEALSMAGGFALEESILWSYVADLLKPPLSEEEKQTVGRFLTDQAWIREAPDSMDPQMKQYVITELGRNQLASL